MPDYHSSITDREAFGTKEAFSEKKSPHPALICNEGQMRAISHNKGPMLVLAGPGSGKTYVITHRIIHLIQRCAVSPQQILVITFTKAAAQEMQERAGKLSKRCCYVQFGTFHSVFFHILKASGQYREYGILTDREKTGLLQVLLQNRAMTAYAAKAEEADRHGTVLAADAGQKPQEAARQAERYIGEISRYKNGIEGAGGTLAGFAEIYRDYERYLAENKKMDFDDMLVLCGRLLQENKAEREKWQSRFSYVMIDEFQDINPLQYEIVKLLCKERNFFAVGDDDQSIYGFRGASPGIMQRFVKEFAAQTVRLSYNYRCSGSITAFAAGSVAHNQNRFPKEIQAVKAAGKEVAVKGFPDANALTAYIRSETAAYSGQHKEKTQAVLTRTNSRAAHYKRAACGELEQTIDWIWEDLFAYWDFINRGHKRRDFIRIMNKPQRYISQNYLSEETVDLERLGRRLGNKPWQQKRVEELAGQMTFCQKLDCLGQFKYIYKTMGYERYLREKAGTDREAQKRGNESFEALLERVRQGEDPEEIRLRRKESPEGGRTWRKDSTQGSGTWRKDSTWEGTQAGGAKTEEERLITVTTYHGAKGLEFDKVYLPDLNFGVVPHGRMLTQEELEEERRMFYVALTRAKEELELLYIEGKKGKNEGAKSLVSPFLTEMLPEDL